jgi:23S rRNA pseudouridine1911/1915/1917 synthase
VEIVRQARDDDGKQQCIVAFENLNGYPASSLVVAGWSARRIEASYRAVMEQYVVTEALAGERLDKALLALLDGSSRARVKRAIETGSIRVNGRYVAKGGTVNAGDIITVAEVTELASEVVAAPEPDAKLAVLFENGDVLLVDKPGGQPSAPLRTGEVGTLANALVGHYPELAGVGYGSREPGLLHRLDNDTSGVLLVARNDAAFSKLRTALHEEKIQKTYQLICNGDDLPDTGTISIPLANHPKDQRRVYACVHPRDVMRNAPKAASTEYEVESRHGHLALVRVTVAKARRHQIRAHFAAIEHPLVGDTLYGGIEHAGLLRHALHAATLSADLGGNYTFSATSPLPADMAALLSA